MNKRHLFSPVLLTAAALVLGGCDLQDLAGGGQQTRASRPAPTQAAYRINTDPAGATTPSYREDAVPSGLSGFDSYDEPGELQPNSGGTNAGRVGADNHRGQP